MEATADVAVRRDESRTGVGKSVPRVLFLGLDYSGARTRCMNLRQHAEPDTRIDADFRWMRCWSETGRVAIGPLPVWPSWRLRWHANASCLARIPRPDVIWTGAAYQLTLWAWAGWGPMRRPFVLDLDATPAQLEAMAPAYEGRPPRQGPAWWIRHAQQRVAWSAVTHFTAWSHWAAAGLEREGISADRITVLPPGIDLDAWQPGPPRANPVPRLLFVGADFKRKGGPLLLDVVRNSLAGRVEVDVVTHDSPDVPPGVRVHRSQNNSAELRALYRNADLFVLPTRADFSPVVAIEAMASGLPVVVGDVGATREIVDHGRTGWVIPPTADHLATVLEQALRDRSRLEAMGRRARAVAEARFDGARNDRQVVDLLLRLHESHQAARRRHA